jgi:hypothetical protein
MAEPAPAMGRAIAGQEEHKIGGLAGLGEAACHH